MNQSHPVDDDPIMASAIGRCSNSWTHAETTLAWIFVHLTDMKYAVAVTVFSFFKATRTQRDVLKKNGKITPFMTNELNKQLADALKAYCRIAEERNQLLHNPIGRSVENQVYQMIRTTLPNVDEVPYEMKLISPAEIDGLTKRIKDMTFDLRVVERAISEARHPPKLN